ncbi:MAG: phosphoglycolate phosphatase [Pseudomonadales bacterium]
MKRFDGYFFDLDGTLIDSVPDLAAAVDDMLRQCALPAAGVDKVRDWVGNGAAALVRRALCDAQNLTQAALAEDDFEAAFALFLASYRAQCCRLSKLYPAALETLSVLCDSGAKLALITNKPEQFTYPILEEYGLAPYFERVLGGDSLSRKKPDPLPLVHTMAHLGLEADHCLMVGDSISDVSAARNAGVAVAAVNYGYNHGLDITQSEPDWVLNSLGELLDRPG